MNDLKRFMQLYQEFKQEKTKRNIEIVKHFTLVSSALLGVVLSKPSWYAHNIPYLYESSLYMNMISVFGGCLFLVILLKQYDRMDTDFREQLKDLSDGLIDIDDIYISTKYNTVLRICRFLCLFSFLIALVLFLLPLVHEF